MTAHVVLDTDLTTPEDLARQVAALVGVAADMVMQLDPGGGAPSWVTEWLAEAYARLLTSVQLLGDVVGAQLLPEEDCPTSPDGRYYVSVNCPDCTDHFHNRPAYQKHRALAHSGGMSPVGDG